MKYDSSLTLTPIKSYEIVESNLKSNLYSEVENILSSNFSNVEYFEDNVDGGDEKGYVVDCSNFVSKSFLVLTIDRQDGVYLLRLSSYDKPQLYTDVIMVFSVLALFWSLSKLTVVNPNPIYYAVLVVSFIIALSFLFLRVNRKLHKSKTIMEGLIHSVYSKLQ